MNKVQHGIIKTEVNKVARRLAKENAFLHYEIRAISNEMCKLIDNIQKIAERIGK